jgi:hypothetical protein
MVHRIVPRSEWKAKPPRAVQPEMRLPATELWVHHTDTRETKDPHADARKVQDIGFRRGFNDISYSYLIHPNGTILAGRGTKVGAHTAARNSRAIGVAFIGNYTRLKPHYAQIEAARWLVTELKRTGVLSPRTTLWGHRQNPASPSECPGKHLFPRIKELGLPVADGKPRDSPPPPKELTVAEHNLTMRDVDVVASVVVDRLLAELRQTIRHVQHAADTVHPEVRKGVRAVGQGVGLDVVGGVVQPPPLD